MFLKRGALAVLPKAEGWHLLVVSVARTSEAEPIAPALDRLARRLMRDGTNGFAAAPAATADGARAALAVAPPGTPRGSRGYARRSPRWGAEEGARRARVWGVHAQDDRPVGAA